MDKKGRAAQIRGQMKALGISTTGYAPTIDTLASILVQRDKVYEEFLESGGEAAIEYTNKGGSTNLTKNPLLIMWDDLNKSALAYWRELGLTPSSYKKMIGGAPAEQPKHGLAAALAKLDPGG